MPRAQSRSFRTERFALERPAFLGNLDHPATESSSNNLNSGQSWENFGEGTLHTISKCSVHSDFLSNICPENARGFCVFECALESGEIT